MIYAINSTHRYSVDTVFHNIHRHDAIRRVPGRGAMVPVGILDLSISAGLAQRRPRSATSAGSRLPTPGYHQIFAPAAAVTRKSVSDLQVVIILYL